jgi:hypothetical protein
MISFVLFGIQPGGVCKIFYLNGLAAKYCGSTSYGKFRKENPGGWPGFSFQSFLLTSMAD